MKVCVKCNKEGEFYPRKNACKECARIEAVRWAHSEAGKVSRVISQKKRYGTEKLKQYARKYSKTSKGIKQRKNRWNRWVKTDKGKETNLRKVHKRRNTLLKTIATLTLEEWKDILFRFSNRCFYCNEEFTDIFKPTRDHVIPIVRGGQHIKENIVPACRPCNSRKGAT